jgi:hypothetical protein
VAPDPTRGTRSDTRAGSRTSSRPNAGTGACSPARSDTHTGARSGPGASGVSGKRMLTEMTTVERNWHRSTARVMGSDAEILVDGPVELIRYGFGRLRQLEQTWSRFLPDSELNRLHDRRAEPQRCSDDLLGALQRCLDMYYETGGLFDPSIRVSLERLGYDRTFADIIDHLPATVPATTARDSPASRSPATSFACRLGCRSTSAGSARAWPPTWSPTN